MNWDDLLQRFMSTRSQTEAAEAASDILDIALPGGSIVADDAGDLVRAIPQLDGLKDHAARAFLISVVGTLAQWSRGWRRLESERDDRASTNEHARQERETSRALAEAAMALDWGLDDLDPEVRAMAYRLAGAVDGNEQVGALTDAVANDPHEQVRTSAAAALLDWAVRHRLSPEDALVARLRELIESGPPAIKRRMAQEASAAHWTAEESARARELVGLTEYPTGSTPYWPAEGV